jgi:nucleoside-diphosphate-sugar epimerase
MAGVDYVLHQAALSSVPGSIADPVLTNEINIQGTLHVLMAARDAGVKRVVYASSAAVYGDNPALPKREDMPADPLSPYAVSKLAGEGYCRAFHVAYGLPAVSLRYFNVFGPRQDPGSHYAAVIPKFITALLQGEQPTIYGDGTQSRDFVFVADVVHANLLACEREEASGRVFNIACGRQITVLDLYHALSRLVGTTGAPSFSARRPGDVMHSLADIGRAKAIMGYEPLVDWQEGLAETLGWYRQRVAQVQ